MNYNSNPISKFNEDYLNRKNTVLRLNNLIKEPVTDSHIRIGLFGPWGCGKSSIISMFEGECQKKEEEVILKFFPWQYHSESDIKRGLVSTLCVELLEYLEDGDTGVTKTEKAKSLVSKWGQKVSDVIEKSGVKDLEGKYLENDGFFTKLAQGAISTIEFSKENVDEIISKLNDKKVILVVEDLDRCQPELIPTFLQFLREIFNTPSCFTILMADQNSLNIAIQNSSNSFIQAEQSFIDKFFDISISIGSIDEDSCLNFLSNALDSEVFKIDLLRKYSKYIPSNPRYLHRLALVLNEASKEAKRYEVENLNLELLFMSTIFDFEFPKLKEYIRKNHKKLSKKEIRRTVDKKDFGTYDREEKERESYIEFIEEGLLKGYLESYPADENRKERIKELLEGMKYETNSFFAWENAIAYLDFVGNPATFTDKDILIFLNDGSIDFAKLVEFLDENKLGYYDALTSLIRLRSIYCEKYRDNFNLNQTESILEVIYNATELSNIIIKNKIESDVRIAEVGVYKMLDQYRIWCNALTPHGDALKDILEKIDKQPIELLDFLKTINSASVLHVFEGMKSVLDKFRAPENKFLDHITNVTLPALLSSEKISLVNEILSIEGVESITDYKFTNKFVAVFKDDNTVVDLLVDELLAMENSNKALFDELVYKFFYICATSSNTLLNTDVSEYIRSNLEAKVQSLWNKIDYSKISPISHWLKDRVEEELSKKGINLNSK